MSALRLRLFTSSRDLADDRRMNVIAVVGASPGIGKSTLCAALAKHLRGLGLRVDHFDEADVLKRPQFSRVAADFAASGRVSADVLVDATVDYLESSADMGLDVVVADALMPFVPSLLAFGHSETAIVDIVNSLATRMGDIEATPRISTVVVYLDGDVEASLRRAAAREGPGWLDWYGDKLARYGLVAPRPGMADLCRYLAYEREVTIHVIERVRWRLLTVADAADQRVDARVKAIIDGACRVDRI